MLDGIIDIEHINAFTKIYYVKMSNVTQTIRDRRVKDLKERLEAAHKDTFVKIDVIPVIVS